MKKLLFSILFILIIFGIIFAQDIYNSVYTQNVKVAIRSSDANTATLGDATHEFGDLFLGDASVIYMGNDQDITITHSADEGIIVAGSVYGYVGVAPDDATADTLTAAESGKVFYNDGSNGAKAFVLPTLSTALVGVNYTFVCGASETDAITITTGDITDTSGDMFLGGVLYCAAAAVNTIAQSAADNCVITLDDNLANSGAGPGTWIKVTAVGAATWFVQGIVEGDSDADGTGTAIFSDAD